jgi:type I restriction enzyme S subunit
MRKTLDELCEFINGGSWSDKEYVSDGIPVLKVSNLKVDGIDYTYIDYIPETSRKKYSKHILSNNDLVIATVGSHPSLVNSAAGRATIINKSAKGYLLNQNAVCLRTKNEEILNQKYLAYIGKTKEFQHFIQQRGKGAANQMRIAIGGIKEFELELPPINIQNRIASILSAYDDLIENNLKRIKLLEELAQRTYEEWFVKFRINGEQLEVGENGLPKDWLKRSLSTFFEVKTGKKDANFSTADGEYPFFTCSQEPIRSPSFSFDDSAILLAGNGEFNVKIYRGKFEAYQRTYVLIPKNEKNLIIIYRSLKKNLKHLTGGSKGSVIKYLTKDMIENFEIIYPNDFILKEFNDLSIPLVNKIENLQNQNNLLKESRDILLPRLMSGKIGVEVNPSFDERLGMVAEPCEEYNK